MNPANLLIFLVIVIFVHIAQGIPFSTNDKIKTIRVKPFNSDLELVQNRTQLSVTSAKHDSNSYNISDHRAETFPQNTSEGVTIPLIGNQFFCSYSGEIKVGGQTFRILFDTGSFNFWIPGDNCQGDPEANQCYHRQQFNSSNATSFHDTGKAYTDDDYGVIGEIVTSDINIAGAKAQKVFFNVADYISYIGAYDGVIGLAYNQTQTYPGNVESPFLALYKQGAISQQLFSIYFDKLANVKNGTSELTLGGIDHTKYKGDLNYLPVQDENKWMINLDDLSVNGKKLGFKKSNLVLDTGYPNIYIPTKDAAAIHKLIPDSIDNHDGSYTLPCNTTAKVTFIIGGVDYSISPQDLVGGIFGPPSPPPGCMSAIYGVSQDNWELGSTFFQNVYVVFDYEKSRVGIATTN